MNVEVRRQKKLDIVKEKDFRGGGVTKEIYNKDVVQIG